MDIDLLYPEHFSELTQEQQSEITSYLESLDERQKKAYLIAKEHLGTSFQVFKSNGYQEWKKGHSSKK